MKSLLFLVLIFVVSAAVSWLALQAPELRAGDFIRERDYTARQRLSEYATEHWFIKSQTAPIWDYTLPGVFVGCRRDRRTDPAEWLCVTRDGDGNFHTLRAPRISWTRCSRSMASDSYCMFRSLNHRAVYYQTD